MKKKSSYNEIKIIGLKGIPIIREGDDIGKIICETAKKQQVEIEDGDIIVIASKIIAKAEGRLVNLATVTPSIFAQRVAELTRKDPRLVELILQESNKIVKMKGRHLIMETRHGFVCANAGIDRSNVMGEKEIVSLLPKDPDLSARKIMKRIEELTGRKVAIIISDTFGRAWRRGHVNFAIGVAGMKPIKEYIGRSDMFGYTLRVTQMAIADELAAAAELAMGKADGIPVVIIKGYDYPKGDGTAQELIYPEEKDLFR